jgi:UPF0716 family protein affecting phage T7 exclusion
LFLFVALLLIQPGGMTDIVGFVLFVLLVGYQYMKKKKSEHVHVETSEELIV